ncbi:MAG: ABC transporter ATP-binding protein [Saccharofermentanales bacterium]
MKAKMKLIWSFARKFKLKFSILYFCILFTTFIGASYPYIFGRLVDEVFYGKNMSAFIRIVILYGVLFLTAQIGHFILNMTWAQLMTRFLFDIRKALFDKSLSLKAKFLYNMQSGDILKRINYDTDEFMNFIHWNVLYASAGLIDLILILSIIFFLNWKIGLVVLVITPVITFVTRHFAKKIKVIYAKTRAEDGVLQSWIFEILKGMREVVLLGASRQVLSIFTKKYIRIMRYSIETNKIETVSERVNSSVSLIAKLVVYALSGYFVFRGEFTVGAFVAVITYFIQATSIFSNLMQKWVSIQSNMAGVERVQWLLDQESESVNTEELTVTKGDIVYENVSFNYNDEIEVLTDINFSVKNGEKVALVGKSGAGKSTIANLLLCFYNPDFGRILIDGQDISKINFESLRNQIGIVWQDILLFDGTIRQNLAIANKKANDSEMLESLKKANLFDFVQSLPDGLDTVVSSSGQGLSGGQKQRLAIARIFLKNPKMLIFDEATSSLDYENEQSIKDSWNALSKDRTTIIIAHRLSTIIDSDKVAVLSEGKIVAFANHKQLLGKCKEYDDLYASQYGLEMESALC